jgi:deoxyribodipyrimidine photo-lyase
MNAIWWIRRDLRLRDNLTLQAAMDHEYVLPVFILDPHFGREAGTRRHRFLFNGLRALDESLRARNSYLVIRRGEPLEVLRQLMNESNAGVIYAEEDFTPYARQREEAIATSLPLKLVQGQLAQHPLGILKSDGKPYTVFTPFSKTWKSHTPSDFALSPAPEHISTIPRISSKTIPNYPTEKKFPVGEVEAHYRMESFLENRIYRYGEGRNRLDLEGTSSLSPYIHFGMLGQRTAVQFALQAISSAPDQESRKSAQTWLSELIWREFYIHILYHYPWVLEGNFRPQYNQIRWRNHFDEFVAWKEGQTGYPIVDAAMRQLTTTGWMHNRARMIVASFLVKDLLIDWRWGERWFMQNLLDGDLAANNGGWQWTAGTGTDAAPYFRIFNPILQSKKFDPNGDYIRKWVPELAHLDSTSIHTPWEKNIDVSGYPAPIVDHKYARERALDAYQVVRK